MATLLKTMADLKRHARQVGNSFFNSGNARIFGSPTVYGIYRQPYSELSEGYVITVNIFTYEDGTSDPSKFAVYRFAADTDTLDWWPIGRHDSLEAAEAFLSAMGAVK